ncbi:hypothetical protein HAZT_HAZT006302 [Hyalella azteca]|uniref:Uncharacterized protein n=1 Tax=Hyalella azteca TaxID=294128 RepID=A0A6A0GXC1_HYAAZ|nr:hypothetical protein HAZT_HAZT006302 [Hyalella azteca]
MFLKHTLPVEELRSGLNEAGIMEWIERGRNYGVDRKRQKLWTGEYEAGIKEWIEQGMEKRTRSGAVVREHSGVAGTLETKRRSGRVPGARGEPRSGGEQQLQQQQQRQQPPQQQQQQLQQQWQQQQWQVKQAERLSQTSGPWSGRHVCQEHRSLALRLCLI